MHDQANALRGLMERRVSAVPIRADDSAQAERPFAVTLTSGKGGVGKSNLALNLAIALARSEQSVLLIDANWGVGHIDLLSGLNGYWNLSHVVTGTRRLEEVVLEGPAGVRILPGAGCLAEPAENVEAVKEIFEQLDRLKAEFDFVIVDLGTGIHRVLRQFVTTADRVLIVTTPEPPSIADAYAIIKSLSPADEPKWEVLINGAESSSQADQIYQRLKQTTRLFLRKELEWAGSVPRDSHVAASVAVRKPFLLEHPHSSAALAVKQLARRLVHQRGNGQKHISAIHHPSNSSPDPLAFPILS